MATSTVANRRNDEQETIPEPQSGIQGESGAGCLERREDAGGTGAIVRRSRQPDHAVEAAASGGREWSF